MIAGNPPALGDHGEYNDKHADQRHGGCLRELVVVSTICKLLITEQVTILLQYHDTMKGGRRCRE